MARASSSVTAPPTWYSLAVCCSLGNAAVRSATTAVVERAAEHGDQGAELGDAAAVLVACHDAIVPTPAEAT